MRELVGDLIQLALEGEFDLIIHGCNCFRSMEAGIAKAIKTQFPEAFEADLKTVSGDLEKLGTISWAKCHGYKGELIVVNAYTQYQFAGPAPLVDYDAIRQSFRMIKEHFSGLKIGYPKIGAGLGGGDWKIISKIIDEELIGEDHTLIIYGGQ
ncbi:MAG: macro domain-containing protein [Crocinitomicaceae bacterium]|nr:macro domain-containing protein [Crocinitomicaceae bacterium]